MTTRSRSRAFVLAVHELATVRCSMAPDRDSYAWEALRKASERLAEVIDDADDADGFDSALADSEFVEETDEEQAARLARDDERLARDDEQE